MVVSRSNFWEVLIFGCRQDEPKIWMGTWVSICYLVAVNLTSLQFVSPLWKRIGISEAISGTLEKFLHALNGGTRFKFFLVIYINCPVNLVLHHFQHGGDVNAADHTAQTALHWSAVRGAIQVAEVLLQEGAMVNAADMYGYQVGFISFPGMKWLCNFFNVPPFMNL